MASNPSPVQKIGQYFKVKERNSTFTQEIRGGLVSVSSEPLMALMPGTLVGACKAALRLKAPPLPAVPDHLLHPGRQLWHPRRHRRHLRERGRRLPAGPRLAGR